MTTALLVLGLGGLVLAVLPYLFHSPERLFYFFMATFVVSEIAVGSVAGVRISLSNVVLLLGVPFAFLQRTFFEAEAAPLGRRARTLIVLLALLIVGDIISAAILGDPRFVASRVNYLLTVVLVFLFVSDKRRLMIGVRWGVISMGVLGLLTFLRSAGLSPIGTRADYNWGLVPWDRILPRAIGLPQMDGGQFGVFTLTMLPVGWLLAWKGEELGMSRGARLWCGVAGALGSVGVLVAQYRAVWLGTLVAGLATWLLYPVSRDARRQRHAGLFLLMVTVLLMTGPFLVDFTVAVYRHLLSARSEGLEQRLLQYVFALSDLYRNPRALLTGFGVGTFEARFGPVNPLGFSSLLHNHFLNHLYIAGLPSTIIYLSVYAAAFSWLLHDAREPDPRRWIAVGLFAGLLGAVVTINFNVRVAGYNIIWVDIALASLLPRIIASRGPPALPTPNPS